MKRIIITLTLVVLLAGCAEDGVWSIAGGSNYETTQVTAMYSPDPNGGIGVMLMTDSSIPDDTEQNVAVGPVIEFDIGQPVVDTANYMTPGPWDIPPDVPVQLMGTMAVLWETDGADMLFLPGTELRWLLSDTINLYVKTEWLTPEGNSTLEDDFITTFGARINFR